MTQKDFENPNNQNGFNNNIDNICMINTAEFEKSLFDNHYNNKENHNRNIEETPNFPKSKSSFQTLNMNSLNEPKNTNYNNYKNNKNLKQGKNKRNMFSNSNNSIRTTPNRSFFTKSKLSTNSKNNSLYKNSFTDLRKNRHLSFNSNISNNKHNNNSMIKKQNKEINVINKLIQEVEHIKNYCNELQRQFDNHCLIKNEKKEFENIKKENIKLNAEVSILKDDVTELMKKFGIINNKIDNMQQENNNLKLQNKNLLNFISIMSNSNSVSGIKKLKNFNFNNNSLINNNRELINQKNNKNNESMNIINLINNKNSVSNNINNLIKEENRQFNNEMMNNNINLEPNQNPNLKYKEDNNNIYNQNNNIEKSNFDFNDKINNNNLNINNLNSDFIEFSISKSMSKNFEKAEIDAKNYYKTINNNESRFDYTNANTNSNTNINQQSKTQYDFHNFGQDNKNYGNNASDIAALIRSNFNLTNQNRNSGNSKNKQNRFLIPKNDD